MQSLVTRRLEIAGHSITLQLPADPEQLLEESAAADTDCDPYWGILWDASIETANCVLQTAWPDGHRALELGCGAGLVGIAGLLAGLCVTFSDLVPQAVDLAVQNAIRNGFPKARGQRLDWRDYAEEKFDVLLASDVLYESRLHAPLLQLAQDMLAPNGEFWIGDPGRQLAREFLSLAADSGWNVQLNNRHLRAVMVPSRTAFQLIVLSRN